MKKSEKLGNMIRAKTGALFIYVMLLPLFISVIYSLFAAEYLKFVMKLGGFALLFLAASLASRGIRESIVYEEAKIAKAPFPYKGVAAFVLAGGIFYLGYIVGHKNLFESIFVSILALVGMFVYYGVDPRRDKVPAQTGMDTDILLETLEEARSKVESLEKHAGAISDPVLRREVEKSALKAGDIIGYIESDPSIVRRARRFLVVYVDGVESVVEKYISIEKSGIGEDTKMNLRNMLEELQKRFDAEAQRLRADEHFELEVEIEALKEELKNI